VIAALMLFAAALDPVVQTGFDHFYNLEFPEAVAVFRKAVADKPDDADRRNHLAQSVLFQMMFRAGALETELVTGGNAFLRRPKMEPTAEEQKLFADSVEACLRLTSQALARNPNDTTALYAQGVALGLRGTFNFLVRRVWMEALRDLTSARKLHNRVLELDPSNVDARMTQGVHDYVVGSLPWGYRFLGFLAGFHGDRDAGIRALRLVAEKGNINKADAQILLGTVLRRERRPAEVVPLCQSLLARYPRNVIILLELSQMYADLGNKDEALAALDRVEKLKRSGTPGFATLPFERIEFARGNLLFWYEDYDTAIAHLKAATAHADLLDPNSGVTAWLRLGQCLDLKGRRPEAQAAYRAAAAYWPSSDPAREARRYLDRPYTPAMKAAQST
jgi:tetratricopeptide (TPR) repeat protein